MQQVLDSLQSMFTMPQSVVDNIRRQLTLGDPVTARMTFTDFLVMLQKEAWFRDVLSDSQIYKSSACRIKYGEEVDLLTM